MVDVSTILGASTEEEKEDTCSLVVECREVLPGIFLARSVVGILNFLFCAARRSGKNARAAGVDEDIIVATKMIRKTTTPAFILSLSTPRKRKIQENERDDDEKSSVLSAALLE